MIKRIIAAILFFVFLCGASSCIGGKRQSITEMSLEYIEKKYGKKFEFSQPWGDSMTGTHELLVTCDSLSEPVLIEVENYRKDNRVFRDNYIAVKYKQETYDFLMECAIAEFSEAHVYYSVIEEGQSETLSADATFEEFLADTRAPLSATIVVKASSLETFSQVEQLANRASVHGAHYYFTVISVEDDMYAEITKNDVSKLFAQKKYVRYAEIAYLNGKVETVWLEGKLHV